MWENPRCCQDPVNPAGPRKRSTSRRSCATRPTPHASQRHPPACLAVSMTTKLWCQDTGCENHHDPRCLPFHIFESEQINLDTPEERRRFNEIHGPGGRRRDDRDFSWCLGPGAFHGNDVLHVAGHTLPRGFHWDVSVQANPKTITTPTERWQVARYINIAPDANLRGRPPHAKRIGAPKLNVDEIEKPGRTGLFDACVAL